MQVYCKGGSKCAEGAVHLDNIGREGHTFLHHIVENYDTLAKWTVFSQAEAPSEGYLGHEHGGGHMLTGSHFDDYILQPVREKDADSLFLMTSKVHLPTLAHSFRSSFKVAKDQRMPPLQGRLGMCPGSRTDSWGAFQEIPWLQGFVNEKCGIEAGAVQEALATFWQDYVQLPQPKGDIVHYTQGARFAASRDRILQRPKAFYERLLQAVATEEDTCLSGCVNRTCTAPQDEDAPRLQQKCIRVAKDVRAELVLLVVALLVPGVRRRLVHRGEVPKDSFVVLLVLQARPPAHSLPRRVAGSYGLAVLAGRRVRQSSPQHLALLHRVLARTRREDDYD
jgi:hypothetical protein